jgi:hypothetical protein
MRTQERVPSRCASSTPPVISFFPFCFLFRPNPFRFLLRPNPCTRRTRTPRTQHPIKGELKPSCRSTISCSSLRSRRHAPAARLYPRVPVSPRATTRCAVAQPLQVPASHLLAPLPPAGRACPAPPWPLHALPPCLHESLRSQRRTPPCIRPAPRQSPCLRPWPLCCITLQQHRPFPLLVQPALIPCKPHAQNRSGTEQTRRRNFLRKIRSLRCVPVVS